MTWTLAADRLPRLGAWLVFISLLAACADFLGIEERKPDSAANYPATGYAGCRPGNCAGCLDVHRRECEARTTCANAAGHDDCAGCVCENCEESVVDCQLDSGCNAIWQCLRETRCDLSERANGSCTEACGNVVQANGGLNGPAFHAAVEIRTCAAGAACLTCLAPQVQQSARVCSQQNACQDCDTCFDQCLCSGERFGECQRLCQQEGAPPTACTEEDSCVGCSNCFDACACGGQGIDACNAQCTTPNPDPVPDPNPTVCTQATSCVDCLTCTAQCVCSGGGDESLCTTLCAPPPPNDACVKDVRNVNSRCDGCESDIADCRCSGGSMYSCNQAECDASQFCDLNQQNCYSFQQCTCFNDSAACFAWWYGSCEYYPSCDQCACGSCPGDLGMCQQIYGCMETFNCMRSTNCQGSACQERCLGGDYPLEAFGYAEALWACNQGAFCGCNTTEAPPAVDCPTPAGITQCQGYQGSNVSIDACCPISGMTQALQMPGTGGTGGTGGTVLDSNPCGLQLNRYYSYARSCEPRAQSNPPRYELLETCNDGTFYGAPYNGAVLKGCCRGEDHSCGFFDDVTGLGCLSAGVFGLSSQACP